MVQDLIGKTAPALTLTANDESRFSFQPGESGIPTVVFFFVACGSSRCSKQVRGLQDLLEEREAAPASDHKRAVQLLGVCHNPPHILNAFAKAQRLSFPLLSDPEGVARRAYRLNRRPSMFPNWRSERFTVVIDAGGVIYDACLTGSEIIGSQAPSQHVQFVERVLNRLDAEGSPSDANGQADSPSEESAES